MKSPRFWEDLAGFLSVFFFGKSPYLGKWVFVVPQHVIRLLDFFFPLFVL
jgi:hypothetical protein